MYYWGDLNASCNNTSTQGKLTAEAILLVKTTGGGTGGGGEPTVQDQGYRSRQHLLNKVHNV